MACVLGARRDRSESNLKDRGHIVDSKSVNGIRVEERSARSHDPGQKASPARTVLWVTYGLLGVLLAGFLFSLIIRGDNQYWPWLDGWLVCGVELVASALCITRGLTRGSGNRAWPLALGVSLLSWSVGDVVLTVQSLGGATPPTPSLADVFYLGFYPFCYIAVVMFMRGEVKRLTTPSWLDGAIAGLGAAAVCAAFAFHSIVKTTGGNIAATITSLAYPIGDLLLLGLVVGGTAMLSGRRKAPWILLASGIGLNVVGDTFNLFQSSQVSHVGSVFNGAAWPTAIVVMSAAVWLRSRPSNLLLDQRPPGFLLPGLTAASALGILFVSSWHHVGRVAIGLATATLMTVGIRLALSVRGIRVLSQERHRQSVTDDLTGLANRRYLFRVLDAFFADARGAMASQRTLAFLFIDLNRFKEINDSFGHPAGDELLKQLGARLAGSLRDTDLLVRIGGDEFAVVLIDGGSDYATTVAARVTASLEEPFVLDVVSARISASIGIALAPADATDSAGLVWCADVAMYRAKLGNSSFAIYERSLDEDGDHLRMLEELRTSIEDGHLVLHYQPQLDLRTGEILAVEALIRWEHPRLGLLPPDRFLPLAEEAGLMQPITPLDATSSSE